MGSRFRVGIRSVEGWYKAGLGFKYLMLYISAAMAILRLGIWDNAVGND